MIDGVELLLDDSEDEYENVVKLATSLRGPLASSLKIADDHSQNSI